MTTQTPRETRDVIKQSLNEEMQRSFSDYAFSVVLGRALPDVRDGLKTVHRRVLYAMHEGGYRTNFRKSARVVGDVIGKYHPHGDSAIYETLVRLAQDFSMSSPLVDGQGNFGNQDGDPAAAMRYTECRLSKIAEEMLEDIPSGRERVGGCVDWRPNYDGQEQEPVVLPARFPQLLVNGSDGIAVGVATNIPPHNLIEVVNATRHLLAHPQATYADLLNFIPGPDFPTGGTIVGRRDAQIAGETGRGSVRLRAKHRIEESTTARGGATIVFDDVPYQVERAKMVEDIKAAIRAGKLEGAQLCRDETGRVGTRIVVELKSGADADAVVRQIFKYTCAQVSYSSNMRAIVNGRPTLLGVLDIIHEFLSFRRQTVRRRTIQHLRRERAQARAHIGIMLAVSQIDEVVEAIRAAPNKEAAQVSLLSMTFADKGGELRALINRVNGQTLPPWRLGPDQVEGILQTRLQKLTGYGREEMETDARAYIAKIDTLMGILADSTVLDKIIDDELAMIAKLFPQPRRTEFTEDKSEDEDSLVARKDILIVLTKDNWIKRVDQEAFRSQSRGGKGRSGGAPRSEDAVSLVLACGTRDRILAFTDQGRVYATKAWKIPDTVLDGRGRPLINILRGMGDGERVVAFLAIPPETPDNQDIIFITRQGKIRRNSLSDFSFIPVKGKRAFPVENDIKLVAVLMADPEDDVLLATQNGQAIRFSNQLRQTHSRTGQGVRAITLDENDMVVGAISVPKGASCPAHAGLYLAQLRKKQIASSDCVDAEVDTEIFLKNDDLEQYPEDIKPEQLDKSKLILSKKEFDQLSESDRLLVLIDTAGFGRRTRAHAFRRVQRGGRGQVFRVLGGKQNAAICLAPDHTDLVILTEMGRLIRLPGESVRIGKRKGMGVCLLRVPEGDRVIGAVSIKEFEDTKE